MSTTMALILAAGEGKRMKSRHPKPLFPLCGRPMIDYVLDAAAKATDSRPVIIADKDGPEKFSPYSDKADLAIQAEQLGTGHAVMMARSYLEKATGKVLIMAGDMPLIRPETLMRLLDAARHADAALLYAKVNDPAGYGRIIQANGRVTAIVEDKDCNGAQKHIRQINASIYCFETAHLLKALEQLEPKNAQGEYYLTDVVAILTREGKKVAALEASEEECLGVNDRAQLAQARSVMSARINRRLMLEGVTLMDPANTYIDHAVTIGMDTVIYPGVILEGATRIGCECTLYPGSRISESTIGDRVRIQNSVVLQSQIGDDSAIGPYAYLRPGSRIGKGCRVGDFVEVKNSGIGDGSKVSHLSYIGDGEVGRNCNIGCGVVFVNYDGMAKNKTVVEDGVFIGCNANLIAPVTVHKDAYVAAGSTVTDDVPEGSLCIARARQSVKEGWRAKQRTPKDAG